MQLQLTAVLSIFAVANAAVIAQRQGLVGGFTVSTTSTCPFPANIPSGETVTHVNIVSGITCGQCTPISNPSISYATITGAEINPRCHFTLFQNADCSDNGSGTGSGCWTPDGGVRAYKVTCPDWPNDGSVPVCRTPSTDGTTPPVACKA